jgi:hypothetical protein
MAKSDDTASVDLARIGAISLREARVITRLQAAGDDRSFGEIALEMGVVNDDALIKYLTNWTDEAQMPMARSASEPSVDQLSTINAAELLETERRSGERRSAAMLAYLRVRSASGGGETIRLQTRDLSQGGAFLLTSDTSLFRQDEEVQLLIGIAGRYYRGAAVVARVESNQIRDRKTVIALRFTALELATGKA